MGLKALHAEAQSQGVPTVALGLMSCKWIPAELAARVNARIESEVGASMFLSSAKLLPMCDQYFCSDGVHPTRVGYEAFGTRLGEVLHAELPNLSTEARTRRRSGSRGG